MRVSNFQTDPFYDQKYQELMSFKVSKDSKVTVEDCSKSFFGRIILLFTKRVWLFGDTPRTLLLKNQEAIQKFRKVICLQKEILSNPNNWGSVNKVVDILKKLMGEDKLNNYSLEELLDVLNPRATPEALKQKITEFQSLIAEKRTEVHLSDIKVFCPDNYFNNKNLLQINSELVSKLLSMAINPIFEKSEKITFYQGIKNNKGLDVEDFQSLLIKKAQPPLDQAIQEDIKNNRFQDKLKPLPASRYRYRFRNETSDERKEQEIRLIKEGVSETDSLGKTSIFPHYLDAIRPVAYLEDETYSTMGLAQHSRESKNIEERKDNQSKSLKLLDLSLEFKKRKENLNFSDIVSFQLSHIGNIPDGLLEKQQFALVSIKDNYLIGSRMGINAHIYIIRGNTDETVSLEDCFENEKDEMSIIVKKLTPGDFILLRTSEEPLREQDKEIIKQAWANTQKKKIFLSNILPLCMQIHSRDVKLKALAGEGPPLGDIGLAGIFYNFRPPDLHA